MNKFLICILFGVFASIANASYLYWAVGTDQLDKVDAYTKSIKAEAWTTAKFYEVDVDGAKKELSSAANIDGEAGPVNVDLGDITSKEGYSYYIELVNSSNVLLGYQQGTYASIATQYLTDDLSSIPTAGTWHGASSYNAPEPTSGLLMMLGAAMLGLRRKQRKTE